MIPAATTPKPSIPNLLSTAMAVATADLELEVALGPLFGMAVGDIFAYLITLTWGIMQ